MAKPFTYVGGGLALLGAAVATGATFAVPAQWEAVESVEVAASVTTVFPFVESAEGWTKWLGWRESDDPTLSWTIAGPMEAKWSGKRLGKGVLMVLPGDNGWAFSMTPEQGLAWNGSIFVSTSGEGSRVDWTVGGDFSDRPWLRLFGHEAASVAHSRMRQSLDRLARIVHRDEARADEKARLAAEDVAIAAEIAAQHLLPAVPIDETPEPETDDRAED